MALNAMSRKALMESANTVTEDFTIETVKHRKKDKKAEQEKAEAPDISEANEAKAKTADVNDAAGNTAEKGGLQAEDKKDNGKETKEGRILLIQDTTSEFDRQIIPLAEDEAVIAEMQAKGITIESDSAFSGAVGLTDKGNGAQDAAGKQDSHAGTNDVAGKQGTNAEAQNIAAGPDTYTGSQSEPGSYAEAQNIAAGPDTYAGSQSEPGSYAVAQDATDKPASDTEPTRLSEATEPVLARSFRLLPQTATFIKKRSAFEKMPEQSYVNKLFDKYATVKETVNIMEIEPPSLHGASNKSIRLLEHVDEYIADACASYGMKRSEFFNYIVAKEMKAVGWA